jgi:hypothetical protein
VPSTGELHLPALPPRPPPQPLSSPTSPIPDFPFFVSFVPSCETRRSPSHRAIPAHTKPRRHEDDQEAETPAETPSTGELHLPALPPRPPPQPLSSPTSPIPDFPFFVSFVPSCETPHSPSHRAIPAHTKPRRHEDDQEAQTPAETPSTGVLHLPALPPRPPPQPLSSPTSPIPDFPFFVSFVPSCETRRSPSHRAIPAHTKTFPPLSPAATAATNA